MTDADMTAFCIAAVMLVVMVMTLLLLLTVVFRSTNQNKTASQSSTGGQSTVNKTRRHAFPSVFTIFNMSLLGMVLGSAALFASLLLSLPQSHTPWTVRGAIFLESSGGTLFESCYCIYTWSRSKSLIGESASILYWILTALAILNPILFMAQLVTAVLFEYELTSIQIYHDVAVATLAGMVLMDVGMLSCFCYFLLKNAAPTSSTGQFSGNREAKKQWDRTSIIAKYGAYSCAASFLSLAIIVGNQLLPSLNAYANLLIVCAYSCAVMTSIVLLVMKIKLDAGYGKLLCGNTAKLEEYGKTSDEEC
ncbi:hypothetical protein HDU77_008206 [Chytriomyces hyalinus]|nr:hypothetical protein HDU77_008206 [Chytriomyces hyalinus]